MFAKTSCPEELEQTLSSLTHNGKLDLTEALDAIGAWYTSSPCLWSWVPKSKPSSFNSIDKFPRMDLDTVHRTIMNGDRIYLKVRLYIEDCYDEQL